MAVSGSIHVCLSVCLSVFARLRLCLSVSACLTPSLYISVCLCPLLSVFVSLAVCQRLISIRFYLFLSISANLCLLIFGPMRTTHQRRGMWNFRVLHITRGSDRASATGGAKGSFTTILAQAAYVLYIHTATFADYFHI